MTTPTTNPVRLSGLTLSQLPPGGGSPTGAKDSTSALSSADGPPVQDFLTSILRSSLPFIDSVAPKGEAETTTAATNGGGTKHWRKKGAPKKYTDSDAPVELYERNVKEEFWVCRRSVHRNAAEKGTASWEEFVHGFKEDHPETEKNFTPTVLGARTGVTWEKETVFKGVEIEIDGWGKWSEFEMAVVEMKHKIPSPLRNRVFAVLQVSAVLVRTDEFVVISIPVTDFEKSTLAEFSKDKSIQIGRYVAVERIRILPTTGEIEWLMATASDAGGILPQFIQRPALPGAIAHDVDLFLGWLTTKRKGKGKADSAPLPPNTTPAPRGEAAVDELLKGPEPVGGQPQAEIPLQK